MCGIAGFSGEFNKELLIAMAQVIKHRGPDDSGIVYEQHDNIGLAHQRLSILDLSQAGHQPMWSDSRDVCLVFNGEIYNFRELRKQLEQFGYRFTGNSDTEVLLNLYLHYNTDLLDKLMGMYAFAIWDKRERSLFIARDGIGIKPLYFAEASEGFLFASEMKSLLQWQKLSRNLSAKSVFNHLTFLWCPAPDTILENVKKLEPGYALIVKNGKICKKWQHYDLPYSPGGSLNLSVEEAIEQVQEKISLAVERQLVSDVPVGAFLSGGLDSSAVVAFARQLNPSGDFKCFTIEYDNRSGNFDGMSHDLPYARRVADYLDVDLEIIRVEADIINRLSDMIYYLDEPQADPAAINAMLICEFAKQKDIKVLLSGTGGDDIFTGYRRHYAIQQEKYWQWLPESARKALSGISKKIPLSAPFYRRVAKAFNYADMSANNRLISYFFWLEPDVGSSLFSDNYQKKLRSYSPIEPLAATLASYQGDDHRLNKTLYLEGKHFLVDHNLNYTDKMSMASGVEVRVPLLDTDVIQLATELPVKFKQHGATGKWIFKKAMEKYLPKEVIYRPKTGFGVPLRYWLNHQLKPVVNEVLSQNSLESRGIFKPEKVKSLIEMDRAGKIDAAYPIFSMICIEMWCRLFIDS